MWLVNNELKGTLRFPGLDIEIPAGAEFDLDSIGREKAEASEQLRIAIEAGYLKTVRKAVLVDESELERLVEERVAGIKEKLVSEINDLYNGE